VLCFLFCLFVYSTTCVVHHYAQTNKTKNTTQYVLYNTMHKQTKQKTQHNMCYTPLYTVYNTYCVVFFVLFVCVEWCTTHIVLCFLFCLCVHSGVQHILCCVVKKHNTICVVHHYAQTNKTKNTTQYVLYTTIHKQTKQKTQLFVHSVV
jgi:hypothetical protein